MTTERTEVSLATLGSGAAVELFDQEFRRVLANIADPNTPAKAVREVKLAVKIKPTETREYATVEIHVSHKGAAPTPYETGVFMGVDEGGPRASENNPRQDELPPTIINMKEGRK